MRIQHRYLTIEKNKKLLNKLTELGVKFTVTDDIIYAIEFYLYEDEPHFLKHKEILDKFGIEPDTGTMFDKKDLDNATWFTLWIGQNQYPQPDNVQGYMENTYDLRHYCWRCGTGCVQNNEFRLKNEFKQRNQFLGLHWQFDVVFVRVEAKNIFEREGVTGITFSNPIIYKKETVMESTFQLRVKETLPPAINPYNLSTEICIDTGKEQWRLPGSVITDEYHYCGRVKYNHPKRGGITLKKEAFDGMPDFMQTNEWFGSGGSAIRPVVVSKKVKSIVEQYKLKGAVFQPVFHEVAEGV